MEYDISIHTWVEEFPSGNNIVTVIFDVESVYPVFEGMLKAEELGLISDQPAPESHVIPSEEWTEYARYYTVYCLLKVQNDDGSWPKKATLSPTSTTSTTETTPTTSLGPPVEPTCEALIMLNQALERLEKGEWDEPKDFTTDELVKAIRKGVSWLLANWKEVTTEVQLGELNPALPIKALLLTILNAGYLDMTISDVGFLKYRLSQLVDVTNRCINGGLMVPERVGSVAETLGALSDVLAYCTTLKLSVDVQSLKTTVENAVKWLFSDEAGFEWNSVEHSTGTYNVPEWRNDPSVSTEVLLGLEKLVYHDMALDVEIDTPNGTETLKQMFGNVDYGVGALILWLTMPRQGLISQLWGPNPAVLAEAMEAYLNPSKYFQAWTPSPPLQYYFNSLILDELQVVSEEFQEVKDEIGLIQNTNMIVNDLTEQVRNNSDDI